jgi:hypothetical protein
MLSCGPLAPLASLDEWRRLREAYLRTLDYPDWQPFSFAEQGGHDVITHAQALCDAATIVLWIGTGLADQLLLTWVVQLLRLLRVDPARLGVIQFTQHPAARDYEICGVGLLDLDALARHPPPSSLDADMLAQIDGTWAAVTAPTPDALVRLAMTTAEPPTLLRRSLASLLRRFPDGTTGLSDWDMNLLRWTAERGPHAARVIGHTIGYATDTRDAVGDRYLFARLRALADTRQPRPLVTLVESGQLRGSVELTDAGRAVLARALNALDANGIDEWVGGTHLDSRHGNVWVHENGRLERWGGPGRP